jgi:hypothetical protein
MTENISKASLVIRSEADYNFVMTLCLRQTEFANNIQIDVVGELPGSAI